MKFNSPSRWGECATGLGPSPTSSSRSTPVSLRVGLTQVGAPARVQADRRIRAQSLTKLAVLRLRVVDGIASSARNPSLRTFRAYDRRDNGGVLTSAFTVCPMADFEDRELPALVQRDRSNGAFGLCASAATGVTRRNRVTDTNNEHQLICAECCAESPPDATGWRAYLDVYAEVVLFCPSCAEKSSATLSRLALASASVCPGVPDSGDARPLIMSRLTRARVSLLTPARSSERGRAI
jgi:hypothetical protein